MEEFITDEHENLSSLSGVIFTLEESLSTEEHRQLVKDICILTEHGYLKSDATAEHIKTDMIPEVESITLKGISALDDWERGLKENCTTSNSHSNSRRKHLSPSRHRHQYRHLHPSRHRHPNRHSHQYRHNHQYRHQHLFQHLHPMYM